MTSSAEGIQASVFFAILLPASDLGVSGSSRARGGGVVNRSTGLATNTDVPCSNSGPKGVISSIADDFAAAFSGAPPSEGLGGCMALPEAEPVAVVAGVVRVADVEAFTFSEDPVETSDSFSFPFRLCPPLPIFWRGFTDSPTFFDFGFLRGQREVECPVALHPRQVFALLGQLATIKKLFHPFLRSQIFYCATPQVYFAERVLFNKQRTSNT